jgi:hypothetical protein
MSVRAKVVIDCEIITFEELIKTSTLISGNTISYYGIAVNIGSTGTYQISKLVGKDPE